MDVKVRPVDLASMHPRLLWEDIASALVAVLSNRSDSDLRFHLLTQNVPGYESGALMLVIDPANIASAHVERVRRTYEQSRLVELAAIAIAGLSLYHSGRHEIRDVALRGSGADYLVDTPAGRLSFHTKLE
jgi:hypothetical protein